MVGLLVGALAGLLATVLLMFVWPRRWPVHLRAVLAALAGFGVALLLSTYLS
ncbi:hypothetical protein [Caldinitratiruptor microaerophilus]|uniref:Uncharacterized protein n=1 Tax=Caldinitratiruptor microaerophilus TaxID=671077 RepID=A0AA35CP39_9FIRM|nr:hypothetical protein [Caldinitratiruptor microaerophilus]BDG61287.1 hypothetical protein caldi_23770 [Caldinitratiruptor microaerophilus]